MPCAFCYSLLYESQRNDNTHRYKKVQKLCAACAARGLPWPSKLERNRTFESRALGAAGVRADARNQGVLDDTSPAEHCLFPPNGQRAECCGGGAPGVGGGGRSCRCRRRRRQNMSFFLSAAPARPPSRGSHASLYRLPRATASGHCFQPSPGATSDTGVALPGATRASANIFMEPTLPHFSRAQLFSAPTSPPKTFFFRARAQNFGRPWDAHQK